MKSTEEKQLAGTNRADKEPVLDISRALVKVPTVPKGFEADEKKVWRAISKMLIKNGILTELDLPALTRYCKNKAFLDRDEVQERMFDPKTSSQEFYKYQSIEKQLLAFESLYGLNPKSRKQLGVGAKKPAKSKLRKLIDEPKSKQNTG